MKIGSAFLVTCTLIQGLISLSAQSNTRLRIDTGSPVSTVSPMLYGLMTEEINYSYDGGLYAELQRNRSMFAPHQEFGKWLGAHNTRKYHRGSRRSGR